MDLLLQPNSGILQTRHTTFDPVRVIVTLSSALLASMKHHPGKRLCAATLLWVGCGKDDGAFAASKSFSDFLNAHAIDHTFRASKGAHTWMVWRRYLHEIAPLLFQ